LEENPSCQPNEECGVKKDDPPCIDVQSELSKSKLVELQRKFTGYLGDRVKQFQLEGKVISLISFMTFIAVRYFIFQFKIY
jgi:hypothetical protein